MCSIPTRDRPTELATTLAGLAAQTGPSFRVVVSDQSDGAPSWATPSATTLVRVLRRRGSPVELLRNLPRRGIAEQRAFLLVPGHGDAVLYLDDDVWLEPGVLDRLHRALRELGCGFVAAAMQGLSHLDDRRPHECAPFEVWHGPVRPETVDEGRPGVVARGRCTTRPTVCTWPSRSGSTPASSAAGPLAAVQDRLGGRVRPVRPGGAGRRRWLRLLAATSRPTRTARTC